MKSNMLNKFLLKLQSFLAGVLLYALTPINFVLAQGAPPVGTTGLLNPIKINSVEGLLVAVLEIIIIISIPIIVIFIIYSGFLYVTARGNPQQIEQASKSLTYAIIGGVLIIGAVAIAQIIKNLVATF
jgi:hypothetical protein